MQAIKDAGYKPGKHIYLALDVAASEFYDGNGKYTFKKSTGKTVTGDELVDFYAKLVRASIRSSASKTAAPKAIGSTGRSSPTSSATRSSSSATICSSPT